MRCILQYLGDSWWLGKPKHQVEGVIYRYNDATEDLERIKDVPADTIIAKIDGSWMNQLYYTLTGSKVSVASPPQHLSRRSTKRR